jgi:hypothetical protein
MFAFVLFIVFVILQVFLGINFFRCTKRKGKARIIYGAAFVLVCCLVGLMINFWFNGYSYRLKIDKEKLRSFIIDFDTVQQYEEWFCPEKTIRRDQVLSDGLNRSMTKTIILGESRRKYVYILLKYFTDAQSAKDAYNHGLKSDRYKCSRKVSADYEYSYINPTCGAEYDNIVFALIPDGSYVTEIIIRYKNVIFEFTEFSDQHRSRIDKAIDLLLADYEQYKKDNGLN